jgi:error-prone DNA polymerase
VPTYQSSWLKAHYPAHFLAGVLTHEPGMYPRRLIVEDARQHAIPILPLDVNHSQKRYTVELVEKRGDPAKRPGQAAARSSFGIRIGLQDVHGISDAEIAAILQARAERPFASVGDLLRRAHVSRPVVEALAHAGAFDTLPSSSRRDRLFTAMTAEAPREGDQLTLRLDGDERAPGLREYTGGERVRAELEVTGMDISRHLLSFYEPLLHDLGVIRSGDLRRCRGNARVMVAGVKVASQTPAVRSGQRIIFLTLDDATGPVDVTVFERVQDRCARTVFHGFLLAVWGRLRRTGVGGVSIAADEVWDLQALEAARREGRLVEMMRAGADGGGAAPRKVWHASGGSSGW